MTTAQRSRAADLIERKGQTVTLAGNSGGTYNPATSGFTGTGYSKTVKAVPLPLSHFRKNGDSVREGDEQLLVAGLDTSGAALPMPPVNAVVTLADGTTKRTIIAVEGIDPDGAGYIYYDCITRGNA